MSILFDRTTGLERIGREVLLILVDDLNDSLATQESAWAGLDLEFATRLGRPFEPITLEPVELANFYFGHRPSLVRAPVGRYPNVAVMAGDAASQDMLATDQTWGYENTIHIEVMVKAVDVPDMEGEDIVNHRIYRTVDAIVAVLAAKPNLNGLVSPIDEPPAVAIDNVFATRPDKGRGTRFLWQGASIDYTVSLPTKTY